MDITEQNRLIHQEVVQSWQRARAKALSLVSDKDLEALFALTPAQRTDFIFQGCREDKSYDYAAVIHGIVAKRIVRDAAFWIDVRK